MDVKEKKPAMLWYGREFYEDRNVQVMNLAQKGAYMKLLWVCWQDGMIPADTSELAAICDNTPVDVFERDFWPKLNRCFIPAATTGFLMNNKVEKVRAADAQYHERQASAGRAGAEKRWHIDRVAVDSPMGSPSFRQWPVNSESMASDLRSPLSDLRIPNSGKDICSSASDERVDAVRYDLHSGPESSPSIKQRTAKVADGLTAEQDGWFSEWWSAYWRRVAKKPARKAFAKLIRTREQFDAVMAATRAQSPEMLGRTIDKRPHPATWLNGERWNDETESSPAVTKKSGVQGAIDQLYSDLAPEHEEA